MKSKFIKKDSKKISKELSTTYGNTLVLLASNPEEIDKAWSLLKSDYDEVSETLVLENQDYGKVVVRRGQ